MGQLEKSLARLSASAVADARPPSYANVVGMDISLNRFDAAGASLEEAFAHNWTVGTFAKISTGLPFYTAMSRKCRAVAWASGKPGDEDVLLSMESDTEAYYGGLARHRT